MLKTLHEEFFKELKPIYSVQEIRSLFFIVCENVLKYQKTKVLLHFNDDVDDSKFLKVREIVDKLKHNEPIQYILGETEFYGIKLSVGSGVLIPRQETEEIIHYMVRHFDKDERLTILDVCTGSGCIPVSLAKLFPKSKVKAIDIADICIDYTTKNCALHNVDVEIIKADVMHDDYEPQAAQFDVIISNPPYVLESEKQFMHQNVLDYEPHLALFVPDSHALLFYETIAHKAFHQLKPNGLLFFEANETKCNELQVLMQNIGFTNVNILADIHGKDRFVMAIR